MRNVNRIYAAIGGVLLGCIAACGGGGSSPTASPSSGPQTTLSGVVAVGAPLVNAPVVIKDAQNNMVSATTDGTGQYSVNIAGKTAPFVLQATGTVSGATQSLYSTVGVAPATGGSATANITPLTNAVVAYVSGGNPSAAFADVQGQAANLTVAAVQAGKDKLMTVLGSYLTGLGGSTSADFVSTPFSANGTDALDKVLDLVKVSVESLSGGSGTQAQITLTSTSGSSVVVTPTAPAPTPLPPPTTAEIELPLNKLAEFTQGLTAAVSSASAFGTNGANLAAWMDDDLLEMGYTKTQMISNWAAGFANGTQAWGGRLETPVVIRCEATARVCWLSMNWIDPTYGTARLENSVRYDTTAARWKLYGDRKPFIFEEPRWVLQKTSAGYEYGMNLNISPNRGDGYWPSGVSTAILQFSLNGGTSAWSTVWTDGVTRAIQYEFGAPISTGGSGTVCGGPDFLVFNGHNLSGLTLSPLNCNMSNFFSIRRPGTTQANIDSTVQSFNTAIASGLLRYKIMLKDSTGAAIAETDWRKPTWNAAGAHSGNVSAYTASIPAATWTSNNTVSYTPSKARSVQITVQTNGIPTGSTHWEGAQAENLAGVASVSKAHTTCLGNSTQAVCDANYGANAVISYIFIEHIDAQGRSFWANYSAP